MDYTKIRETIKKHIAENLNNNQEYDSNKALEVVEEVKDKYGKEEFFRGIKESELYSIVVEELQKVKRGYIETRIQNLPEGVNKESIKRMDIIDKIILMVLFWEGKTVEEFDAEKYCNTPSSIKSDIKKRINEYKSIIENLENPDLEMKYLISYMLGELSGDLKKQQDVISVMLNGNLKFDAEKFEIIKKYRYGEKIYPTIFMLNRLNVEMPIKKGEDNSSEYTYNKYCETYNRCFNGLIGKLETLKMARQYLNR